MPSAVFIELAGTRTQMIIPDINPNYYWLKYPGPLSCEMNEVDEVSTKRLTRREFIRVTRSDSTTPIYEERHRAVPHG